MTSINTSKMGLNELKDDRHCNIPKVRFLGTLSDWTMLKRKITYLDRYGAHKWLDALLPVINKLIAAIEGEVDKQFWDAIYSVVQNCKSDDKIHGWVCNFFPYIEVKDAPVKEHFAGGAAARELFRERGTDYKTHMLGKFDFYRGVTAS